VTVIFFFFCFIVFFAADVASALSVGATVGVVLGSALALLLLALLVVLLLCRRRKHIHRGSSTSRSRRLPTFADITLHSEIASFLPTAGSANGLQGLDFGRPMLAAGEVCRQPTAETDDMPPSYDSVVKSTDDIVIRRRRDGNLASPAHRSQARLSLPPLSATAFPPVLRTHRRAESDVEEHIYEDPASLRRSVSRDGLGCALQSTGNCPAVDFHEVSRENAGPSSAETEDRCLFEPVTPLAASAADAVTTQNPPSEMLPSLPYFITSNSSLNMPQISCSQPRIPRVRLGTSALYSRPDSRAVDCWSRSGDFPAPANQLRPFSPLSAIGYAEVMDSFTHPYQTPGEGFPFIPSVGYSTAFGGQPLNQWSHLYVDDPGFELRSQTTDVHSTLSGNQQIPSPTAVSYFSNDLSVVEDRLNSTSSARTSLTESERYNASLVSPLFDDDDDSDEVYI